MLHPKRPLGVMLVCSGEKANRVLCHFIGMLLAESSNRLQSGSFDSVGEAVPKCLNLNGLPVSSKGVLWYGQVHSTTGNSFRYVRVAVILWWLCVTEELERLPQKMRKTLPMESIGVGVARTNQRSARNICHLKQKFKW